ncbi:uncharacterized protein [Lolium perenne]|uniref:uncharacterized protein n=1 Tax=Lolium perenne TaxID=4522 RepID=UPI0021EAEC3A|nr:calcium-dependent protein kinase 27-like [Lolium perenne]
MTTFTDLLQPDGSPIHLDDVSPTHRRSNVGSSPLPRVLYSSGTPAPGPYGPYAPPPAPYGSYPPPPYPYPQPPPHAPPTGSGSGTVRLYPPPSYGSYAPPPYPYAPYGPYPPPPPEANASSSESNAVETIVPPRAKRLDWTTADEEKLVHAWIFNSKDSVAGNCKTGNSFWGQIAETFNSTSEPARRRTSKQLKDHWNSYNKEVSLFNAYHIQEESLRQSGADDAMVMRAAMERYANDKRVTQPFRRHHWWEAVRNEAKWKGQHGPGSGTDSTSKRSRLGVSGEYSSGDATTEEERPTGRDRAKAAARKGRRKGKESSSSSEVGSKSFAMRNMMKGLVKAKLFKQWNKMKDRSTDDMNEAEKRKHAKAIKMVKKELGLKDDDDEEEEQEEEEEE